MKKLSRFTIFAHSCIFGFIVIALHTVVYRSCCKLNMASINDRGFSTLAEILSERGLRSERALKLSLAEMYMQAATPLSG